MVPVFGGLSQNYDNPDEDKDVDGHHEHDGSHKEVHPATVIEEAAVRGGIIIVAGMSGRHSWTAHIFITNAHAS